MRLTAEHPERDGHGVARPRQGYAVGMQTSCSSRLEHCLPALPASIGPLRRALTAYAASNGATARQCEDIALAASEALSNVVVHAYVGHDNPGDIRVGAWSDGDEMHVAVCDDGIGMTPRVDSPGLGLGLAIIGRVCDRIRLESDDSACGVCVLMTFAIR
ncbi:MAG TPA: ATP-binding protein [Solirubrobacteraceae bacterium]|nr:ATP-binding protein [Solirubrobacteraceae bacterium]